MPSRDDFFNLYRHGFVRVAVATPRVRIGDPRHNADATLELMQQAARDKALLAVFPELGLSAYTCDDLFHQRTLIDAAESALAQLLARTRSLPLAALVGLPVAVDGRLYNCAALVCRGRLVGVVPKTYLPNYREFYEARQFTPGDSSPRSAIALAGQDAAFGTNLLFRLAEMPAFVLPVEICDDLWVPAPPSSFAALAGTRPRWPGSAAWSSRCRCPGGACRSSAASAASLTCRGTRRAAICAARRCTASRCRASSPACRRRAPGSSSSASPAGWIPPRRSSSARARSTS